MSRSLPTGPPHATSPTGASTAYTGKSDLWGLLFFDEKLQEGYKAWVKALYAPKNPYTGIPLAKDPAVGIIQVQNEDSLLFWTTQGMKPAIQARFGKKFGEWLVKKYGSLDKAKEAWGGTKHDKDDFANGKVGIFNVWHMTQNREGRHGQARPRRDQFFAETQRQFYEHIADYYRKELGCKQLLNASNWVTADAVKLNDVERWTYTAMDVIAVNKYTGGVHVGDNNGWRIDPGHHFTNQSCLTDPRALPTNLKQVVGHPMIITESTWVQPGRLPDRRAIPDGRLPVADGRGRLLLVLGDRTRIRSRPGLRFLNLERPAPASSSGVARRRR